jgi:hypothetical protein
MKSMLLAAAAALVVAAPAAAQITVDGTRDAAFGASTASVAYTATPPNGNFGTPGTVSDTAYDLYFASDANNVFGFVQSDRAGIGPFANLYFGLNGAGTNFGLEIAAAVGGNPARVNAFIPQNGSKVALDSSLFQAVASGDGTGLEFSLSNSIFTGPIAGLTYLNGQTFPTTGGTVRVNLSQSFGYAVAGGASFGPNRLGTFVIGGTPAVPEPATWAMMLFGFGGLGYAMRRRPAQRTRVRFA